MKKIASTIFLALLAAGLLGYLAFQFSPWPSVWLIRMAFDKDTVAISKALAKHVPAEITATKDLAYDRADRSVALDVFRPAAASTPLPAIVWVHGGAFVYGRRDNVSNYLRILASKGYVTVAVGYSLAPGATYPTPVRQTNAALAYLQENAAKLGIDPGKIFLAGDSAGAQIVGQLANVISAPGYASRMAIAPSITTAQLRGVILHCGPHATDAINFDGPFGGFLRTVLWSYFGRRDFMSDPRLKDFSVAANMTRDFPPVFISVGNGDPLAPLSYQLKARADELGVAADALFFPADHQPPLPHEYQFNLDSPDGQTALDRTLAFLKARS